ncbi:alpha/beta hydrolase [Erythrobacter mangrovi]|uniref:Alpha/beta hydrolase n=1 Tax=Erythrobacter mangrovi TaxID=2739433 RepID=A0A7D4C2N8_9SPHN|nr:alpha/beta hydrolase [Erythrobacter mangrovi]QKG70505.1 alpha/beta hydrolase [Erythrobacter mangrovi]
MPSIAARLTNFALPLLGIKRFFAQPDKIDARIAQLRQRKPARPGKNLHARFDIAEDTSRGFPVFTLTPKGGAAPGARHLLYFHGGGYVMPIAPQHWSLVADLCERLGASATIPLYPLAPEHKAADTLPAMRALYGELAEQYGAGGITIMGDSAGGGMALAVAQMVLADGGALPGSLVLYSPWLDATARAEGQRAIEPRDRMLAVSGLEACGQRYRGELPIDDPRVSPLFGELKGLPRMAIFAGSSDILVVDARRLVARLAEAGLPEHVYHEYEDLFHVWMLLAIPEGRQAREQTVQFIVGK